MGLLDQKYKDQRLTDSQKKKIKPAIQGGGPNYLGKQEEVTVPKKWLSDPDHVVAELAYITPEEKKILLEKNLYGSLKGKPNTGPAGIQSLQGDMGSVGGGSSGGGGNSGGGGGGGRQDTESQYGGDYGYDSSQNVSDRDQQYGGGSTNDRPTIADVSGDKLPGSSGPVDPGVRGEWTTDKKTGELTFTPSTDTITSFTDNLKANLKANPYGLLSPTATLLGTAYQTAKARSLMGLGFNLSTSYGSDGQNVNINLDRGDGDGGLSVIENIIQQVNPYLPKSVAQEYYDSLPQTDKSELSFQARYNNIRNDVNGILNSPSPLGLLAVNESPFYDFLKTRGLDRRIL